MILPVYYLCLYACLSHPGAQGPPVSSGTRWWQIGQELLLQGQSDRAIECFERSLAVEPHLTRNYLSLAAAYLGKSEEERACMHLTLYVAAHPEHLAVRVQYAELLHRLRRLADARAEFERFVADVQEAESIRFDHLVHSHSRLMQIAQVQRSRYDEYLHRGIGLYLLARQRAGVSRLDCPLSTEGLLCRAAAELTLARQERPREARPWWYLHEVWSLLVQSQPASRSLHAAEAAAPFSYLTPAEQRSLSLACRQRDLIPCRK